MLRDLVRELDAGRPWLAIADEVAAVMARERGLYPNVDFYSAPAYRALGIPTDVFPAVFAREPRAPAGPPTSSSSTPTTA